MYPLFKFVRLLSVKEEIQTPTVNVYAWRQHGESSLLALACTNGFILLRYCSSSGQPVVKQLPWPPDHPICSMCFDPTVSWLLVQTDNGNLFIIPALVMLVPGSQVNQLWRLDDVTIITRLKPRGSPTVVVWWHTLDDQQIAIVATKFGEILFLNLRTQKLVTETSVDSNIKNMELVQDDQQITTHLLITGNTGIQWKMLIETRAAKVNQADSELSELGYDSIDGLSLPVTSIISSTDFEEDRFYPLRFYQFPRSVALSPQYAKGRHFTTAHCDKNSTYQVYDSNIEHNPLFVYKLPVGCVRVILTDRILFAVSKLRGDQKVLVISNQRAEVSEDDQGDFNKEAIVQQFDLPHNEQLLAVYQKSFPFYWHEQLEEQQSKLADDPQEVGYSMNIPTALGVEVRSHTVLNGCIIITDTTVYECMPRISPERLFLELCVNQSDAGFAEQLGISLSLDLNFLFGEAANFLLSQGNSKQASRLFHMLKGASPLKRVASFAKYGYIQEVMPYMLQLLSKDGSELASEERKQLSGLALRGLVYRLQPGKTSSQLLDTLKDFLMNNFDYDDREALQLLAKAGLEDVLFEFAMARGLVIDVLEVLSQLNQYKLSTHTLDLLVAKGFTAHLAQAAGGAFLQCLHPASIMKVFCERPQLVAQYYDLLLSNLCDLDIDALLKLAEVLDPSRPLAHGIIVRRSHSRHRTSSVTSLTGSGEFGESSHNKDSSNPDSARLLHCFLSVVLMLNYRRKQTGEPVHTEFLFTNPSEYIHTISASSPKVRQRLNCHPVPIGSGQNHGAAVKDGDLYTWGRADHGRLGHGDQRVGQAVSRPCIVGTLQTLQVKVVSVACGGEHTMAITQQGLYGWGSSQYGQVGLDTRHIYTRPMLVEGLARQACVTVVCGQYHTLALTQDAQVYSWGWGVHGQLGHGDIEDGLVPRAIDGLARLCITKIAGGFCHSLCLSSQGDVYAFGCGFFGQLGIGTTQKQTLPVKVVTLKEKISAISTKYFHSAVVTSANRVYVWGSHPHGLRYFVHTQRRNRLTGQSGGRAAEPVDNHLWPHLVDTSFVLGRIKHVVCGSFHTCLVTRDGDVYTWGRNLDGQIGSGSRQDVRIPQMVTHINDRQVTHLVSGGECNIAQDSNRQVWVWGRNDFGQLGLQQTDAKSPVTMVKPCQSKNIGQPLTEVTVPMPLHLYPMSPESPMSQSFQSPSLSMSYQSRSRSIESINSMASIDDYNEGGVQSLPSLDGIGSVKYDRIVIPVILQSMSNLCNGNQLLRRCVDLCDWCSAASICIHMRNYSQAFAYHLEQLRELRPPDGSTVDFQDMSLHTFQYYYKLVCDKESKPAHQEEEIRNMLFQVLYHWETEGLSIEPLEICLQETLDQTAGILATILFRGSSGTQAIESGDSAKPVLQDPSAHILSKFSTKFSLHLTSLVLKSIDIEDMKKTHPLSFNSLSELGGNTLDNVPSSLMEGDKLSYDQLWQDIMQNLGKHVDSRKYIYVTHSELDRLEEQLKADNLQTDGQGQKSPAVFFTCGHYYTRWTFDRELKRFTTEMKGGAVKLPEMCGILTEYYGRKNGMPQACPRCVLNALSSVV